MYKLGFFFLMIFSAINVIIVIFFGIISSMMFFVYKHHAEACQTLIYSRRLDKFFSELFLNEL